jgi:hypothetical protein
VKPPAPFFEIRLRFDRVGNHPSIVENFTKV